jgi:hypothetical protein
MWGIRLRVPDDQHVVIISRIFSLWVIRRSRVTVEITQHCAIHQHRVATMDVSLQTKET